MMSESGKVQINHALSIPAQELRYVASRSRGPGGQNVNKVESRVTLLFDVAGSPSLNENQRSLIVRNLASRIDRTGILKLNCEVHRTQHGNREEVTRKFIRLMAAALRPPKLRRPTRPTRASHERRLQAKAKRSEIKRHRGNPGD